jgi:small-conductance mechanosensitive channel
MSVLSPLIAWLLNQAVINLFTSLGWSTTFLTWVIPLLTIWFFYRLGAALFTTKMRPPQAQLWRSRILLPIILFIGLLYAVGLLDDFLQLGAAAGDNLPSITVGSLLAGLAIITLFFIFSRSVGGFLGKGFLPQAGLEPGLAHAISTLTGYAIIVIGVVAGLLVTGFNLTTLTVIAGGLSIGLGFGLQQVVSNFISGFILMFDRSIGLGDVIEFGDVVGTVQNIGIRSMIVKTGHNKEVIIPNSYFLSDIVTNLTRTDRTIRVDIKVSVSYESNPLEVEQALLEVAQHPGIMDEPAPLVQFTDFAENSLSFVLMVWVDDPARVGTVSNDLRYRIWDAFSQRNIEFPSRQRELVIRGASWLEVPTPPNQNG